MGIEWRLPVVFICLPALVMYLLKKDVSRGICSFCQGEFAKNKMTQHLKSCKARLTATPEPGGEKQRLFHLLVEGKYRPGYWMHLELPAVATLADLDSFLRFVWLECCDHLSEFEIGDASYSYDYEDGWDVGFEGLSRLNELESVSSAGDEEDEDEGELPDMQEITAEMTRQLSQEFQADLKDVPLEEITKKLEAMFAENLPPGMPAGSLLMLRPLLTQLASSLQQGTLAQDLEDLVEEEEEDEGGMQSSLEEVLKVGERFSYVYDFGSSSTLSLRVIDEREGIMPMEHEAELEEDEEFEEDEDVTSIFIMARNEPPALVCHICGQPATHVPSASEYTSLAETALCDVHTRTSEYPDDLLPIVNSPRTGICGYTGDAGMDEWDEEEEETYEEEGEEEE
jgi:hypothetical protein